MVADQFQGVKWHLAVKNSRLKMREMSFLIKSRELRSADAHERQQAKVSQSGSDLSVDFNICDWLKPLDVLIGL